MDGIKGVQLEREGGVWDVGCGEMGGGRITKKEKKSTRTKEKEIKNGRKSVEAWKKYFSAG